VNDATATPQPPRHLPAAVLWDLDGTLIDSERYWIESKGELIHQFGGAWTREDGLAMVGSDLQFTAEVLQGRGVEMAAGDIIHHLLARVIARIGELVPWRPGAEALLADCRAHAIPCALVTASYRDYAQVVVDALPPGSFAAIVPGEEVAVGKPDPEGYLRAADVLGAPREHCVILEDSQIGVEAAIRSGMPSVAVPFLVDLPDSPGLSRVASLTELTAETLGEIAHGKIIRTV
jgi:HAD superfamily hydrolase (TIGR01509 family)